MFTILFNSGVRVTPFSSKENEMERRKIGCLYTLSTWEDLLSKLPQHANGADSLGLMWKSEVPPRSTDNDPVMKEGWRLAVLRNVDFKIPNGTKLVDVNAQMSATRKPYRLLHINRTAMHLHGVEIVDRVVHGDVHICARVFWPKGADERASGKVAWRNYLLYLDIFPTDCTQTEYELKVFPEDTMDRDQLIMLGSKEKVGDDLDDGQEAIAWATRSANWKPAQGNRPSMGSDQLLCFFPRT